MAVMTDQQRSNAWAEMMRHIPLGETLTVTKGTLRSILNAVDSVVNTNAAALNSAIVAIEPAWNSLSTQQKAYVFNWVVTNRYIVGA